MRVRSSLPLIVILVLTLTLAISSSLGVQISMGVLQSSQNIPSSGVISSEKKPSPLPRLHVEGRYIKDQFGRTVYLKGVNVQHWIWWNHRSGNQEGYEPVNMRQQFIYMSEWGCNVVRINLRPHAHLYENPEWWDLLDNIVGWAEEQGLYVVLDYHTLINTGHECDFPWTDENWVLFFQHWEQIATRFKGRTNVLYDLLNEPNYMGSNELYQARMRQCIDAIRSIDPEVICIVSEMGNGEEWRTFTWEETHPIDRPNVVFTGHMYYKDWWPDTTKATIIRIMNERKWTWMIENNQCLWVGEFNAQSISGYAEWLRNFMEVCNKDGVAGFCAWQWIPPNLGDYPLLLSWDGTPSASGNILQEYLR